MKKIAVFFKEPEIYGYPLNEDEYLHSYTELNNEIHRNGAELYVVRSQSSYQGNGIFSNSWIFGPKGLIERGEIRADVIYDKGNFISDNTVPVLNNTFINEICTNKWKTYEEFKSMCPLTIKINNERDFLSALKTIPTYKKVIKPIDGEEGKDVVIGDDKLLLQIPKKYPVAPQRDNQKYLLLKYP